MIKPKLKHLIPFATAVILAACSTEQNEIGTYIPNLNNPNQISSSLNVEFGLRNANGDVIDVQSTMLEKKGDEYEVRMKLCRTYQEMVHRLKITLNGSVPQEFSDPNNPLPVNFKIQGEDKYLPDTTQQTSIVYKDGGYIHEINGAFDKVIFSNADSIALFQTIQKAFRDKGMNAVINMIFDGERGAMVHEYDGCDWGGKKRLTNNAICENPFDEFIYQCQVKDCDGEWTDIEAVAVDGCDLPQQDSVVILNVPKLDTLQISPVTNQSGLVFVPFKDEIIMFRGNELGVCDTASYLDRKENKQYMLHYTQRSRIKHGCEENKVMGN